MNILIIQKKKNFCQELFIKNTFYQKLSDNDRKEVDVMPKNHIVQFRLFAKNDSIKIALQTVVNEKEKSYTDKQEVIEYYVASDPQNIEKILDTLVTTVKSISIVGPDLHMNYRKYDTFVIENYNQLRRCPELNRFFKKVDRKLSRLEKKTKTKGKRRKVIKVRKGVVPATVLAGILVTTGVISAVVGKNQPFEIGITGDENDTLNQRVPKLISEGDKVSLEFEFDGPDYDEEELSQSRSIKEKLVEIEEDSEEVTEVVKSKETASQTSSTQSSEEEIDTEIDTLAQQLSSQNATEEEINKVTEAALIDVQAVRNQTMPQDGQTNYILLYNLTPEQIDIIKATIQHEAGFNEVEVYAAMSTVINRSDSGGWPGGKNPYTIVTGDGQFQSYYEGYYQKYMQGNYADYTDQIVDAMLTGELEPMHDFERFASGPNATGIQYTKHGNHYR